MGAAYQGACFTTVALATDAYYSSIVPAIGISGNTTYLVYYAWDGSAWRFKSDSVSSSGVVSSRWNTAAPSVSFPSCDESADFFDGMTLGWGVAAAMVAAWGIKFLADRLK